MRVRCSFVYTSNSSSGGLFRPFPFLPFVRRLVRTRLLPPPSQISAPLPFPSTSAKLSAGRLDPRAENFTSPPALSSILRVGGRGPSSFLRKTAAGWGGEEIRTRRVG
ncbi:hypothetical protein PR202_ga11991 [Eleusine coracana subsp. coracana]|uniref:Uncharacterized protein n=1 Tax=Eleusine coracana subsp. coracana TaxID=191504 RepID=A0AAV5CAW9_ELECO|nr:hypothetical protein PR202_ga11991 [Eleusine coracana subsp. coracana]